MNKSRLKSTKKKLRDMTKREIERDLRAVTKRREHLSKELKKRVKL